jgi:hypothetical protein
MRLPEARGEVSERLLRTLARPPHPVEKPRVPGGDPLEDDDLHLALYLLYELHYRGLPGVEDTWEWDPGLLAFRAILEHVFEEGMEAVVPLASGPAPAPEDFDVALREIADADAAPSVAHFVEREATLEQALEFLVHRSAYQLKEADPHSWALPRLSGPPKAALVEIQADEYGGGRPDRVHATLFAKTMAALGLDPAYGAYVDRIPGFTLATVNLMSLIGLHRRRRGAIIGHLALFEMTSSVPARRYVRGLERLGVTDPDALDFFFEHVEADAVHESVAAVDLAGGLARAEPALAADILWGATALREIEGRFARRLLGAWTIGESSLRIPLTAPAVGSTV